MSGEKDRVSYETLLGMAAAFGAAALINGDVVYEEDVLLWFRLERYIKPLETEP